jgi:diguanylate cyclase (GGDEF)-like protein/putative nucleotidyltransferase with HDIG domain/PAS domain S-box-containing protein
VTRSLEAAAAQIKRKGVIVKFNFLAIRVSLALACLTASVLFAAAALGLLPDRDGAILEGRKALCETIAIDGSIAVQRHDTSTFKTSLEAILARNHDLLSAAVRRADGDLVLSVGDHQAHWQGAVGNFSTPTHVQVPIACGDKPWGRVELALGPISPSGASALLGEPVLRLIAFVAGLSSLGYFFYLRGKIRRPDSAQASAAPQHVRDALDTLAEGVLVLDSQQRIALANEAFGKLVNQSPAELQGRPASELSWAMPNDNAEDYPWVRALRQGAAQRGAVLSLRLDKASPRLLSVNSTPIVGDDGSQRGTLATFDDLTVVERKNTHLRKLLHRLHHSRTHIQRQNQELRRLATRDPLTGCLNRRSFFEAFETCWSAAKRYGQALTCVMVDIDRFKSINDRHGHAIGDQALQQVAGILKSALRQSDLICRYGGEEFCLLLPHSDLGQGCEAAERFRGLIESARGLNFSMTASFGVSALSFGAEHPTELLNQADRALYAAKRTGRNRVVHWGDVPDNLTASTAEIGAARQPADAEPEVPIPFHAVTALLSALGYRNADTADHSRRVAELCVAAANGLMSQSQCYVLEIAALLHDIGKLGVPDSILLKPGPLTEAQWKVIRTHEGIGVEILRASFTSAELVAIVASHHAWYGGSPHDGGLPSGEAIPLGARILAIADAFDAMVSDRVYRKAMTQKEAFAELRKNAGTQFDPKVVEHFVSVVMARDQNRNITPLSVAKQTAVRIGMQIEKLAHALDTRDLETLTAMAGRLSTMARLHGVAEIADAASKLECSATSGADWAELVQLTIDLLELCRSTYSSYLPNVPGLGSAESRDGKACPETELATC